MTSKVSKIEKALKTLKYKDDSVKLSNIVPLDIDDYFTAELPHGVDIIGGRDFDYSASTSKYEIFGSAYYGTVTITLKVGKKKPKEKTEDIYTRTSFERYGSIVENVKPVVECDSATRDSLVEQGILHLFYICFSSRGETTLYPFYAVSENDVRLRALSIWGSYDDIMSNAKVEELQKKYGDSFSRCYHISTYKTFVLDWN